VSGALHYLSMRVRTRLAYRGDLAVQVLADVTVGVVGVVFLTALFSRVPDVAGWTFGELLVVWGLAECVTGLTHSLFTGAAAFNRDYLLGGELDRVLLRPLDPWAQVLLDHVGLQGLTTVVFGAAMIGGGLMAGPVPVTATLALLPVFALGGTALLGAMLTLACSTGFFVQHRGSAVGLVHQAAAFGRYPLDVFPSAMKTGLTTVFPAALLSAVPAAWMLGRDVSTLMALGQPILGLLALALAVRVWRVGLRRYASAGS
jgi:ABC-2 type transport system permease protein